MPWFNNWRLDSDCSMIKAELKRVPFKMRVELADLARVKYSLDGTYEISKAFTITSEFVAAGLFGKRLADLDEAELKQMDSYSDEELVEFCDKVREYLGNPTQG